MKKLLLTTITAAGLVLSGQAAATPFYLDLSDDATVNPLGPIEQLDLSYDSYTEVNLVTNEVSTRAGTSLIGYDFGGVLTSPVYDDFADMVLDGTAIQNTFTYTPSPGGLGVDYTGGSLDIYAYDVSDPFNQASGTSFLSGPVLLMSTMFSYSSINIGEQVVESLVTDSSLTAAGEEVFYFSNVAGTVFTSFQQYIEDTLTDIVLSAAQTVSIDELEANILAPLAVSADGSTVLVSDDHTAAVTFQVAEPSTVAVFGLGLMSMFGFARRRRQK
ncbi:PEP-CTERM sorting domain-containing protein [Alteromonas stellipolaris]|uniref:PEP-CTERM sorting domain-containing protein n=1 Tax=Alteromonas stellipolaris TaxID=233316 RepID=UPI0026E221BC|nr:PEP-CTERM sorting domain-containing protein [Alteromonas stellipolaris]MDO6533246.1 PEP-CTERM sorting domain-containing protein [Alteromonas stellipolaris]